MAIVANVTNGVLNYNKTDRSKEEPKGSDMGYDQFLQLLCAEMQYQDPLQPTTNTEYVAQMATFSQLEATLSVQDTQKNTMANSLVGRQVVLAQKDANGVKQYIEGRVDYVTYQNGDAQLSVNNSLYPLSDLDTVADDRYYEASGMANAFEKMLVQFPDLSNLNESYGERIKKIRNFYDGMTDYQKGFVRSSNVAALKSLEERMAELAGAKKAEETKSL